MAKGKTAALICTASIVLLLVIGFIVVGMAEISDYVRETGTSAPSDTDGTTAAPPESTSPATESETAAATEPVTEPVTTEPVTEPPLNVEIRVMLPDRSLALVTGEESEILFEILTNAADQMLLSASSTNDAVVTAEFTASDAEVHEIKLKAVAVGECAVEIYYDAELLASVAITVSDPPETSAPKDLPAADFHNEIDPSKPMLAMTFDDGPGNYTDELLDILAENGARATFMVVGTRIAKHEDTIKRIVAEGHEIGIHTWDHTKLTTLSYDEIVEEVDSVRRYIRKLTGVTPRIMRPPYGSTNDDVKKASVNEGFLIVRWNVDPEDWKTRNAETNYNEVMSTAKDGCIILCHDIHKETVESMKRIIPDLIAKGYQLVTVSELLEYSSTERVPGEIINKR